MCFSSVKTQVTAAYTRKASLTICECHVNTEFNNNKFNHISTTQAHERLGTPV